MKREKQKNKNTWGVRGGVIFRRQFGTNPVFDVEKEVENFNVIMKIKEGNLKKKITGV